MLRVGINGFGRIGRQVLKALYDNHKDVATVVALNDLYDVNTSAHLLEFDSTYGRAPHPVSVTESGGISYGDWTIACHAERDPRNLPASAGRPAGKTAPRPGQILTQHTGLPPRQQQVSGRDARPTGKPMAPRGGKKAR